MMDFDIVIVGGGMVGATIAVALKNSNLRIALIDAVETHAEDKRLIALNHSSCLLLKNLGIWPSLANHATPIRQVHISRRGHFGITRLNASELALNELGHLIPAKYINVALYDALAQLKNFTRLCPATLTDLHTELNHVSLTIAQQKINTRIVIAADGTHSTVRKLLKIPTEIIDYQQKALVTQIDLTRSHQHVAYERFLAQGAIAMLPLGENQAAMIWSGNNADIENLLKLSDEDFLQQLQQQFGYRLGKLKKSHERFFYPLQFVKAREQITQRIILIGNAAHTVHPIAAQGLNLALYEIAILAEHFTQQTSETLSLNMNSNYFQQQNFSLPLSHHLTQLFSADFFILNATRQIGMVGLDLFPKMKQHFVKRLLGKTKQAPLLLIDSD